MRWWLLISMWSIAWSTWGQEPVDWSEFIELYNEQSINTEGSEFGTAYWNDKVVFVRSNPRQKLLDKNTREAYFDLYSSPTNRAGLLDKATPLSRIINSDYHEGPATFSKGGDEIFFTRVDYDKGEFTLDDEKGVALKLFESTFENGSWSDVKKSALNLENHASAHPAISSDGQYMIFASDREDGHGKMDLYISYFENSGWSPPRNMGPRINSSGNDWFPFINERGYLFFASDGRSKGGDLDVYVSESVDDTWTDPLSLPYPINTRYDDFGMTTDINALSGHLSSNRPGGKGKDDIYSYSSLVSLYTFSNEDYNQININIKDQNGNTLPNIVVRYKTLEEKVFQSFDNEIFTIAPDEKCNSILSDMNGKARINLEEGYTLLDIQQAGKQPWQLVISNHGSKKHFDVKLKDELLKDKVSPEIIYVEKEVPSKETIKNVKVDVGAVIVFDNIYYDYNSHKLTTGAKMELDVLANLMLSNQNLKIQLSAHTDARGESDYNMELSQKRAMSAKTYLVSKGIPSFNIQAVGYGETQLRNHCNDDVQCSEAEHIYNRRTEVKILQK